MLLGTLKYILTLKCLVFLVREILLIQSNHPFLSYSKVFLCALKLKPRLSVGPSLPTVHRVFIFKRLELNQSIVECILTLLYAISTQIKEF